MKKTFFLAALAVLCMVSCQKEENTAVTAEPETGLEPICFSVGDASDIEYRTKSVSEVTSVSTVYITAGNGTTAFPSSGSISNAQFNLNEAATPSSGAKGGYFVSGTTYYWPSSPTNINFICTNVSKTATLTSSGATMSVAPLTDSDVMVDCVTASSGTVAFTLNHIFYRLGSIKLKCAQSNMTAKITGITITPTNADATVTITSDGNAMDGGSTAGAAVSITPSSLVVSGTTATTVDDTKVDMMLATPSVTIKIDYTLTMPGYSGTHSVTKPVTNFTQGKKSNLTGTISMPSGVSAIDFTVEVVGWGSENITETF